MNQRAFSTTLDVSSSTIAFIETDDRLPSRGFLQKISVIYSISSDWLLNGHGEQFHAPSLGFKGRTATVEPPNYDQAGHGDVRIDGYDCIRLRRMDLSVSAGSGVVPLEGPDAAPLVVPLAWMQQLRVNADLTVLVRVNGDSMVPTIPDGSLVLLHLIDKTVARPGIYAFNLDGQTFVKRLIPSEINGDGQPRTVMIISDNPSFPPAALSGPRLNDLRIVGRVRAVFSVLD